MGQSKSGSKHRFNTTQFIEFLTSSQLLNPPRIETAHAEFQKLNLDHANAKVFADYLVSENLLTKWQASKLLRGQHFRFQLGSFILQSHLGSGGMSTVYLAQHTVSHQLRAI
ncbi:MAG: hypothetical protein AAGA30_11690, partial [Planctomycetota bacterium]